MSLRVLNKSCVMYILLMSVWNKVVGARNTKMMNRETESRLQKLSQLKENISLKILLSAAIRLMLLNPLKTECLLNNI